MVAKRQLAFRIFPPCLLLLLSLRPAQSQRQAVELPGGTIHGIVKSGNMPIPGAAVSISSSSGSSTEKISTWTDVDGSYSRSMPYGSYTVSVQMAAFASGKEAVTIDASHPNAVLNFELTLLSRTRLAGAGSQRAAGGGTGPRGFQSLSLAQNGSNQEGNSD